MILILGKNGQLASDLRDLYARHGFANVVFWGSDDFDLSNPQGLREKIVKLKPQLIINASAYTKVDQAESEKSVATAINEIAVGEMARAAADLGIYLIHFSTDYVFDGIGEKPWTESDPTGPLGFYGASKLNGEKRIQEVNAKYLIFRTSWVYSSHGKNFLKTILKLSSERESLKIVADQIGSPTYSADLAEAIWSLQQKIEKGEHPPSGVYHLTNTGTCSWHEFATKIITVAKQTGHTIKAKEILPIPSSEYPTPAKRPLNSRLNNEKAKSVLGLELPPWQTSMENCLKKIPRI